MTAEVVNPTKVDRVLRAIERVEFMPWQNVTVEDRDGLWIIRAERPGNVFTAETLVVYVGVRRPRTIEGTDIRMRYSETFRGATIHRFGGDVHAKSWRDLWKVGLR